MSIKLTKTINGKKVELDLISLNGKTVIRDKSLAKMKEKGITEKELKKEGYAIESEELKQNPKGDYKFIIEGGE